MTRVTLDELRRLALEELDGDEWVSASGFALRLGLGGSYWYRVSLVCERLVSDGIAELRTGPNRKVRWFRLRESIVTTGSVPAAELAGAIDCRPADHAAWDNPFQVGRDGSSEEVAELYRHWLWREIRTGRLSLEDLAALHGKSLDCRCAPESCHCHVLAAAAEWAFKLLAQAESDRRSPSGDA